MKDIDLQIPSGAIFSEDRRYRYTLWRVWNPRLQLLMQIGLNPSTANEIRNDPTISRGITRAYRDGYGGFLMGNLYAYVSTNPKALLEDGDKVGELNDAYLRLMVKMSLKQLCGWGSFPEAGKRAPAVLGMLTNPHCLGINADGQPKHPLYIAYDVPMVQYTVQVKPSPFETIMKEIDPSVSFVDVTSKTETQGDKT